MLGDFLTVLAVLVTLVGVGALGFSIRSRPFRPHPAPSQPGEPAPIRQDLPAPVLRHFEETIGLSPQTIHSAVVWGRGRACIRGVWVPLRFKAWFRPGQAFYRRVEVTWFQRPVLRGIESYIDGKGYFEMAGRIEEGPDVDQSQLLDLWASCLWTPSVLAQNPRAVWEAVDELTARLVIGDGPSGLEMLAHFDPHTRRMTHLSAERPAEEPGMIEPWRLDLLAWKSLNGMLIPDQIAVASGESGSPNSYWYVEGVSYNVNVADQIKGSDGMGN